MQLFLLLVSILTVFDYASADNTLPSISFTRILKGVNNIQDGTVDLTHNTGYVMSGPLGVAPALQVHSTAVKLHKRLKSTSDLLRAFPTATFSPPQSLQVALKMLSLQVAVRKSLKTTAGKADAFGELSPIVQATLLQLRHDTAIFGQELVPRLGRFERLLAPALIKMIDGYFDDALAAFGG
ncbi:hypothetical protein IWX90DRAFT_430658 [Phyllosticta citrichinensis]|uniref:Uncharacterized protein n=1 Tax=Phyllosticta citrichinensis TaxID=1130410 RepID=A0ABR1XW91_9PEZI